MKISCWCRRSRLCCLSCLSCGIYVDLAPCLCSVLLRRTVLAGSTRSLEYCFLAIICGPGRKSFPLPLLLLRNTLFFPRVVLSRPVNLSIVNMTLMSHYIIAISWRPGILSNSALLGFTNPNSHDDREKERRRASMSRRWQRAESSSMGSGFSGACVCPITPIHSIQQHQ